MCKQQEIIKVYYIKIKGSSKKELPKRIGRKVSLTKSDVNRLHMRVCQLQWNGQIYQYKFEFSAL